MRPLDWIMLHPEMTRDHLGYIPQFIDADNPLSAIDQIQRNYPFGGWQPMEGWKFMKPDGSVQYPGDPMMKPLARAKHAGEDVFFYESAWVGVRRPDGSYEIARLD